MSSKINILVTGATGFIGGNVVGRLLTHPNTSSFKITALVRSAEKAEKLKSLGIEPLIGSFTDKDLKFLVDAAAASDVVMAIADADVLPAALAILEGLKIRYKKTGKAPIYIHTSGTALLADFAGGLHSGDANTFWSDLDADRIAGIPISVIHRHVDIPIMDADKEGYVNAYIITPSMVYGRPSGPLVDTGISKTYSITVPWLLKAALSRKKVGHVGEGLNRWSATHVEDTTDLFVILLESSLKDPTIAPHGYYFTESLVYTTVEVSRTMSETLVELGLITDNEPNSFSEEELDKFFGPVYWPLLGSNSLSKGERGRALGWKPAATKETFIADLKLEVKFLLSQGIETFSYAPANMPSA